MTSLRCLVLLVTLGACTWRTSAAPPSPCTALSVNFNEEPHFVVADSSPALTVPYTVIVDDLVLGVVQNDSSAVLAELRGMDGGSIRSFEIVKAATARSRWPTAVGDVLRVTRCHEPLHATRIPN